jgi:hypothetical protein
MFAAEGRAAACSYSEAQSLRQRRVARRLTRPRLRLLAALMWARKARALSLEISQAVNQYSSPSSAMASKASGSSQFPTPRLFKYGEYQPQVRNKLFGTKSRIINEWFRACRVLLLCLVFIVYQTKLSKSTELFDLSELSASQQGQLWTQVDNWAVAVVLANFCERPTSLEERMLKIATRCITPSSIKKVLDRFRATMKNVEGNIWDCTDKNVQTFVEKTVAKANLLVNQAEDTCRIGSIYHQLLPLLQ